MRVSCSSEGDQLLYSWTLNGDPQKDGNSSIDLDERSDGDISCSVKNHVSHAQNTTRLKPCPGLDRFCSFDQSDPCYTALGHKLNLMMLDSSEYDLKIQKRINNPQDDPVCRVKNDKMKRSECDLYRNRPEVTVINGTLIINPVNRTDSGNYRLILSRTQTAQKHLEIFSGVMRVSCSSEGDQLLYSWTLNGDPQKDGNSSIDLNEKSDGDISCSVKNHVSHAQNTTRLKPCPGDQVLYSWTLNGDPLKDGNSSIDLDERSDGDISCSVKNHVSHAQNTTRLKPCSSLSLVFVLVWCLQMMVLLGLLGAFHIYMRHTSGKKQEDQEEDEKI
ncbi:uncharacterized protein LOC122335343 [Puntigrus tetrazona]|uniref:uncharacterized protein LOC122335343 n=1 Tax=Puntigrus tetrazona TaxID=1606681 RepID=UPI001C89D571|nr:uncharacterized protein LOC122335343 [Puntigrus tetrazona]